MKLPCRLVIAAVCPSALAPCVHAEGAPRTSAGELRAAPIRSAARPLAQPRRIETTDWIIAPIHDGLLHAIVAADEPRYTHPPIEPQREHFPSRYAPMRSTGARPWPRRRSG